MAVSTTNERNDPLEKALTHGLALWAFVAPLWVVVGLAVVWRYRDRRAVAALVPGLVVALKIFFWPLLIWLVATRRYRTAAFAALASVVLVVVPWAGIGFAGLRGYPHLLSTVSRN